MQPKRKMRDAKVAVLRFCDREDPERNLSLPSSRRTTAARPAETKALYLAARKLALEKAIKPPLPTGDVEQDYLTLRQWLIEPTS